MNGKTAKLLFRTATKMVLDNTSPSKEGRDKLYKQLKSKWKSMTNAQRGKYRKTLI